MLDMFDRYYNEVTLAFGTVQQLLEADRFADASKAMTAITATQARTSTSMRAEMIRAGLMKEDQ